MVSDNSSNTTKVLKGVSIQTVITITIGVLEIVSFSIMSRLLSDKDFGYYAAIIAIVTVFQTFSETGIGSAIIQKKNLDDKYVNNAFSLSLLIGSFVSLVLFVSAGILARAVADVTMTVPLRIISITLLCNCLTSVNTSLLQRDLKFIKIGIINIIALVVTTIIAIILAIKGFGYYAIITKGVLASIISLVLSFFIAGHRFKFICDLSVYKQIFSFGGWLMASAVFRNIASQVDRLLMTSLFSVQTLGFYTRPKEFISMIAGKCNTVFDSVLFPVLSTLQDNKERLQKSFKSGCYLLNLFAMILSILLFCNSELLIRIFFGEKWLHINTLFKVLSIFPLLLINGRMGDIFLRSLALTKQQFLFRVGQLLFAVAFILVGYRFGLISMTISVMASYFCITAFKIKYMIKKMGLPRIIVIKTMLVSYRFVLFVIPFYIFCLYFIPNNWAGNIIQAVIIVLILIILFVFFPNLVGKEYKEGGYAILNNLVGKKLLKKG